MAISPCFLASIIALSLLIARSETLTCTETGTPAASSSLPTPPTGYVVDVEANILDKGYTAQAQLVYSYTSNAAAVRVFSQGEDHRYIFSYKTDEIFTISGTACSVSRLTTSTDVYSTWLLGYYRLGDGQLHVNLPSAQWFNNFTYGTDYGPNYIENTTMRGIPVDHWQTCGKWQPNRYMMVDVYFAKNWTSASTYPRVPVRVEIIAEKQLPNGSLYTLHHIYDFYNFKAEEPDSRTMFQTPVGVVCPGRKHTKSLPKLPDRFYVRTEVIYEEQSVISYEDIWYDAAFKYYRRDYRPLIATYPTYSYNPLTEIHDYYIGARYVIDKGQGNCTTLPLSNTSSDVAVESVNGSYIVHLRNPLKLFDLDWNYTYIGQVIERGVLCDVYVTTRSNLLMFDMLPNSNTTITFYFLSSDWDSYDSSMIEAGGLGIPVKMVLQDDVGLSVTYNYVDFALKPMLETYDISVCYPEAHQLKFQVRFQGVIQQQQELSIPLLKDAAHRMFAQQMGVAYLRIQQISVEYDDAYTYISATLLDKTPPTAQFQYIPGKVIEKLDDSIIYNVSTPFQCAGFCINSNAFICNSFDFCANDQSCRLSRSHIGDGQAVVKASKTCDHFSRSVNGVRSEPSMVQAYDQMRMKIFNKTLTLPLNMGQLQPMIAVDVSVTFGWLTTNVEMPGLYEQFHYRIETIIPATEYTAEGEVWYDMSLDLMRYDTRYTGPPKTFRSSNKYTIIDDFSTGTRYVTRFT